MQETCLLIKKGVPNVCDHKVTKQHVSTWGDFNPLITFRSTWIFNDSMKCLDGLEWEKKETKSLCLRWEKCIAICGNTWDFQKHLKMKGQKCRRVCMQGDWEWSHDLWMLIGSSPVGSPRGYACLSPSYACNKIDSKLSFSNVTVINCLLPKLIMHQVPF